ncbi:unnamed protein product [Bursaphelenchus okinawaensis]|uniref:Uncharacterized protein n=1 Tax=Bursaphelenchus okinawaensis TaxID=465554 RepID=A0A811JX01_9BILA|nr:unnamed protein product [Bursaphelenchus okinawaensis]CAG9086332.1 unnamed protein product [Bursaphelenchus okinawaensis]
MPPKKVKKKKLDAEDKISIAEEIAAEELLIPPTDGATQASVASSTVLKPQKIRLSDFGAISFRLNKVDVRRFVQVCNSTWKQSMKDTGICRVLKNSIHAETSAEFVACSSTVLDKWSETEAIDLYLPLVKPYHLSHLADLNKGGNTTEQQMQEDPLTTDLIKLKILEAKAFKYPTNIKKPDGYNGSGVHRYANQLWHDNMASPFETAKEYTEASPEMAVAINVGGPISALAICPTADEHGQELLAVSTFLDEECFQIDDNANSYVQFYSFNPEKLGDTKCVFLLEIPSQTVMDMTWCPNAINIPGNPKVINETDNFYGFLAISTHKGLVLIYRVPKTVPKDGALVPVLRMAPVFTLNHPKIDIKVAVDENEDSESQQSGTVKHERTTKVPIFSVIWSHFKGGALITATSEASRILMWDLTEKPRERSEKEDEPYILASNTILEPKITIFETAWTSPPNAVCFLNEKELVISFRNRIILVYKIPECEVRLTESTPKSAGFLVTSAPTTFGAFVSTDAAPTCIEGIMYAQSCVISIQDSSNDVSLMPLLNSHQLQVFDAKVCPRTGINVTVGADGRLQQSMNARIGPKVPVGVDCDVTSLNFITGRPLLHLVRHRKVKGIGDSDDTENDDENPKVLIKHDDIVTGNWLEVRCGDAALMDLVQVKKHRTQLALCLLDRRIESLTRVALSTRTAGFTAAGGEAGLVFLMPTMI